MKKTKRIIHFREAALKAAVVLVPSYLAAYLTDKMVWVVPTLAASSFFAATIGLSDQSATRRVEEEDTDDTETSQGMGDMLSHTLEGG